MTFEVAVVHGGKEVRYREITETRPDGSQLYRHFTAGPDGNQFEMIRSIQRRRT